MAPLAPIAGAAARVAAAALIRRATPYVVRAARAVAEEAGRYLAELANKYVQDKLSEAAEKSAEARTNDDRSGKDFTKKGKQEVIKANEEKNGGAGTCEGCKRPTVPGKQSESGVTPPPRERQVDHITPKSKGGAGSPGNGQVLCRECNRGKSDKLPPPPKPRPTPQT